MPHTSSMFHLRDIPKYEALRQRVARYPEVDPAAVESCLVLLRVASDVLTALETFLARYDMSQGRFTTLMVLNRDPRQGLCPSDLASKCGVTRATMTGLLDGLERDKLVTREQHANDRRMATVLLTEEGIRFLDKLCPDYYRRIAGLMGKLKEEEKLGLEKFLKQVNEGINVMLAP
jgi:DNA-binding MarR family transcriptional regulator